jgi:serine protease AprX
MRDLRDGCRAGVGRASDGTAMTTGMPGRAARSAAAVVLASLLLLALPGSPGAARGGQPGPTVSKHSVYLAPGLARQAASTPDAPFAVIVQGDGSEDAAAVARHVAAVAAAPDATLSESAQQADRRSKASRLLKTRITALTAIDAVAARLTGEQILALADAEGIVSITPDAPVAVDALRWSSDQLWVDASGVARNWEGDARRERRLPAIAIVDSGVESRADFGGRLVASVDLTSRLGNSPGDGRGHGTFVAGIAAGSGVGYAGASPAAELVSIDVIGDDGTGLTSDVIRACAWILEHAHEYDIRVANFSLHSTTSVPFHLDPLNRAVEQLWFGGIVVVTAAGNYGTPDGPSGVRHSPASDPFVITVGAVDIGTSAAVDDDRPAPWSAWGATVDGFAKPELGAPGRYLVGPVPASSTLVTERPDAVSSHGYMQLSGTSFAAPVVSGAVASLLARAPALGPDEVKGALMLTARPLGEVGEGAVGAGLLAADVAALVKRAPNPNEALWAYVRRSEDGAGLAFDADEWHARTGGDASWSSASWNSASWNSVSWNSASWNSASWSSASWNSASWNSASWNSASWNSASWNSDSQTSTVDRPGGDGATRGSD